MKIGELQVKVGLSQPSKLHYGSDPVDGHAEVTFISHTRKSDGPIDELFGPLQITAVFQGQSYSKITRTNLLSPTENKRQTRRSTVMLFSLSIVIFNDTVRLQPGETRSIPFRLEFPMSGRSHEPWEDNPIFESRVSPLPPSFCFKGRGRAGSIDYRLGVTASMPGIQVDIKGLQKYKAQPALLYERRRPLSPIDEPFTKPVQGVVNLRSHQLLPEDQRSRGIRHNMKSLFTSSDSTPNFCFTWRMSSPKHVYSGQPLRFDLSLEPGTCTAPSLPEISVSALEVQVNSYIDVRTNNQGLFRMTCWQEQEKQSQQSLIASPANQTHFSDSNGWSAQYQTPVLTGVTSSFYTYNIALSYKLKVVFVFHVNGKSERRDAKFDIIIHPPLQEHTDGPTTTELDASLPHLALPEMMGDMALPVYCEAVGDAPPYVASSIEDGDTTRVCGAAQHTLAT